MTKRKVRKPFVDDLLGYDSTLVHKNYHPTAEPESEATVSYETIDPTTPIYIGLVDAYAFFNEELFEGILPPCLITMQRKNKAYGYFAVARFGTRDHLKITDEIALNPSHFEERTTEATLSTLVHEMVHLQQQHFGKPSRSGYHNAQWVELMRDIGLIPSSTGKPGGKMTGQQVSHYIEPGGRFALACAELIDIRGFALPYVERWSEQERKTREKKVSSKTRYTCPACGAIAWAKPKTKLACDDCKLPLQAEAAPR